MTIKKKSRIVCPYGGEKVLYPTQASAQAFLDKLPQTFDNPEKIRPSHIYYCDGCGGYHISTHTETRYERMSPKARAATLRLRRLRQQSPQPSPAPSVNPLPDQRALRPSRQGHVLIPGRIYRHFKGDFYRVITTARHADTNESFVVYELLYKKHKHPRIRPFADFMSEVDHTKYPTARQKHRCELQDVVPRLTRKYTK